MKEKESKASQTFLSKKIATAAVFVGVGIVLGLLNPFAYYPIFGAKIFPFAHMVNAITGVLIGFTFSCLTALGIAIIRFSLGIGSIHAFHGGISGAIVVGSTAYLLWKKAPEKVHFAALTEPLGTVFIGGTIAHFVAPIGGLSIMESIFFWWALFASSCVPGCIIGFLVLEVLKKAGISRADYIEKSQ
ncbi:MAG: energy coupling factor transporter S component ThiW [Promethearchaeota archaeon]|nr:MAG: energy coupling factor transporter S component ThiW [Candidatus Lokiarchaeota archaeon]